MVFPIFPITGEAVNETPEMSLSGTFISPSNPQDIAHTTNERPKLVGTKPID
jgi:hypothetical protein